MEHEDFVSSKLNSKSDEKKQQRNGNIKTLWSFATPHKKKLILGLVLGFLATGAGLATPMMAKSVLDLLGTGKSMTLPIALLILLLILGTLTGYAQRVTLGTLAERIIFDARNSLINRFFRAKLNSVQEYTSGELVTRVTSDTVLLRDATTSSIVNIVNGVVSLVGTLVLMAVLDVPLLVATFILVAILFAIMASIMPKIGQANKRAQQAIGDLGGSLESGVRALRTVKSSLGEDREISRAHEQAGESMVYQIRAVRISALVSTIAGGGMQLAIICILGFGAWRVAMGFLEVSSLVAFLLYTFNLMGPIGTLTQAFSSLQSGLTAAARIRETEKMELEDLDAAAQPRQTQATGSALAPHLAIDRVVASYEGSEKPVLNGISLQIPRTGHTALVGSSGAGKTSLFALLLRFLEPTSGNILLDGVPYSQLSLREVRSHIAYVEQETPILPGTVADNVRYRSPDATDQQILDALEAVHLSEKVSELEDGINTPVSATSLSGGERQRLAIARALVNPPKLLLLDEVTAQLDGITEVAVLNAVNKIAENSAVVTIAHRLSTVVDADNIVVFEDGAVRNSGVHAELMERDELYQQFIAALKISVDSSPS